MKLQRLEEINQNIKYQFDQLKAEHPEKLKKRMNMSFSTWVFGLEELEESVERLSRFKVPFIELGGNYGGPDVGYQADLEGTKKILEKYGVRVSGICGFFSDANTLSTNNNFARQTAREYIIEEVKFCHAVGGDYVLVVPSTVGRNTPYDTSDYARSVSTLRSVADIFTQTGVKCAIEPINSAEVCMCSTIKTAKQYIRDVNHPGVQHINGDIFHMLCGESHISRAIMDAGDALVNLHIEDTNRLPLGNGMMDVDTIIMALYVMGYNTDGKYVTGEPLGPGRDSYSIMYGQHPAEAKDRQVADTLYFCEREEELING
ncbi:MAG: sugar phosphate isomerase/epimerase family protein [Christensenella sp.]|nr:sugar phosphate isomerase/epimerase family protein [Christensenella sp.]